MNKINCVWSQYLNLFNYVHRELLVLDSNTLNHLTVYKLMNIGSWINEGVICIPQNSSITGTLPSDCLMSYPEHSLGVVYPSSEEQSVYSTAPADWVVGNAEYIFTAITPRSTLLLRGKRWLAPIYGSCRTKQCTYAKIYCLK